jgi:hypothetical protein
MRKIILTSIISLLSVHPGGTKDFETLFAGYGDIESYIYFQQDAAYFIDTELNGSVETFRFKKFYFMAELFKETHMGRKYGSNMVFDPSRAHWSFGLSARIEMKEYFYEAQLHHDCFHSIDRFEDNSIYWNSPRLGFGTLGYLPKYKYHQPQAGGDGLIWKNMIDYYLVVNFYAPRGISFQKNHDYEVTFNTNLRYQALRYRRLGVAVDSYNLWVVTQDNDFERQHRLDFKFLVYGDRGAMEIFFRFWPYDNQSIRSRADHKWAFGIHLGF